MSGRRDRLREIVETLSRHGLGFVLGAVGTGLRPSLDRDAPTDASRTTTQPERVRIMLAELGPTFVKLGQILSTRPDLLPPAYVTELAKLQDSAPPVRIEAIRQVIQDELGTSPHDAFAAFDDVPLASASIGQAHAAAIDGVEVVVKVRRPGAVESVTQDLEILRELAEIARRAWAPAREYDVVGFVKDFSDTLRAELDYVQEARHAERFARQVAGDPRIHIPRVFWDRTTSRVLTLERVHGIKINDLDALDAAGIGREDLAVRAATLLCEMVFEDGFFHADPHPGNFFVEADGTIGLIDFGMVGVIGDRLREQLVRLLVAVARKDTDRLVGAVLEMCGRSRPGDRQGLRDSVDVLVRRYAGRPLAEIPVVALVAEAIDLLRAHHLQLPREVALLLKVLVMVDGLGRQLDPEFDLWGVLTPFTRRLVREAFAPQAVIGRLRDLVVDAVQLGVDAPDHLRRALAVLEQGGLDVQIRAAELRPLLDQAERVGNRLVAGTITAALIGGIGRVVAADPKRYG
ncbi:ABC1 kinase family protein [Pengzhenrongella frigida]|uniref:ABC1 kinase family protein n=1 Tax=Pengzhenrongella frigida TaxID=1259133 RepID=UPI001A90CE44|nr:AarF/ABC1/UbiB kinase family protein [Cellulomonas sp. HLT2-17]